MRGHVTSLNASVAAALLMYEIYRKRVPICKVMDILIVDGYNMIGAWPELQALKDEDLAAARDLLIEKLAEYKGYMGIMSSLFLMLMYVKGKRNEI